MNLNEISNQDRTFLTLRGIQYDFTDQYKDILHFYKMLGNNPSLTQNLKDYISLIQSKMKLFFNEGFSEKDHDIITIRNIYSNLENIKNNL